MRSPSLSEYLDHWMKDVAEPKLRPTTIAKYQTAISLYLKPGLGHQRLEKLYGPISRRMRRVRMGLRRGGAESCGGGGSGPAARRSTSRSSGAATLFGGPRRVRPWATTWDRFGVDPTVGSDIGTAMHLQWEQFPTAREASYLVEMGDYSPTQALQSATLRGAEALGVADRKGSLEPGKDADTLVVAGDARKHIAALEHPLLVLKNGRIKAPEATT